MSRSIALVSSHGVQPLDISGPAAVFAQAAEYLGDPVAYPLTFLSPHGGAVTTFSGMPILTSSIHDVSPDGFDTVLLGGHKPRGTLDLMNEADARDWFQTASKSARRWGSVCGGAYVLAAWGLVNGRTVATHWSSAKRLAENFPEVNVDPDSLYVSDGNLWTSAGVTAGIDMALALVEADHGPEIAARTARHLVVYMRRPGSQSQFSEPLKRQSTAAAPYADLVNWAKSNLNANLTVDRLAEQAGQSLRSFQRKFRESTGQTPAAFIEDLRLDRAKALLACDVPVKTVAGEVGYTSSAQLTLVFQRRYGVAPSVWKTMHASA